MALGPATQAHCSCSHSAVAGRGTKPASGFASETVTDGAAAQDDVPRRRLRDALEREQTERLQVEVAADELCRVAADHHLAGRALRLQTRRDVRYLSPHVGRPVLAPGRDRCDHDLARVDADAGLELGEPELGWELAGELRHLLDDLEPGVHRVAARRLDRDGIPEVDHGPVTLELRHHAAVGADDGGDAVLVGVEHVAPVLGVHGRRQRGRTGQVREDDRQLPPLVGPDLHREGRAGRRDRHHASHRSACPSPLEGADTDEIYVQPAFAR